MRKRLVSWGLWLGGIITAVRTVLGWFGEAQTVQGLVPDSWGPAVKWAWLSVSSQWFGPGIVVVCLCVYGWLRHRDQSETTTAERRSLTQENTSNNAHAWISVEAGTPHWDEPFGNEIGLAVAGAMAAVYGGRQPVRGLVIPNLVVVSRSSEVISVTLRAVVSTGSGQIVGDARNRDGTTIPYPIRLEAVGQAINGQIVFDVPLPLGKLPESASFAVELTDHLNLERATVRVPVPGRYPPREVSLRPAPTLDTKVARAEKIQRWREMVRTVHKQLKMSKNVNRGVTSLLEANPDFLEFRPHLSERSTDVVYGRVFVVPPDRSDMDGALHSILWDIEALEKEWGLRD